MSKPTEISSKDNGNEDSTKKAVAVVNPYSKKNKRELKLGEAESTELNEQSAIALHDKFQLLRNEPVFSEITDDYICGENLQSHLTKVCKWMGKLAFPNMLIY